MKLTFTLRLVAEIDPTQDFKERCVKRLEVADLSAEDTNIGVKPLPDTFLYIPSEQKSFT